MRLSSVLSDPNEPFGKVEQFINNDQYTFTENEANDDIHLLTSGDFIQINIGKINLPFYSTECKDTVMFLSKRKLHCLVVNENLISIDCDLQCSDYDENDPRCKACIPSVQMWFLIEVDDMFSSLTNAKVIKRNHRLPNHIKLPIELEGKYSAWLAKADIAYKERLGVGSAIYLRSIFENIIYQFGKLKNIERIFINKWGKEQYKNFEQYTEEVDKLCKIIPEQYSKDGYKLFRELSNIAHGNADEQIALEQFPALRRLIISIIDNIKRKEDEIKDNKEIIEAMNILGWNTGGETDE